MVITQSPTLVKYKDTMRNCIKLYYPEAPDNDIDAAIEYSIYKRLKEGNAKITNSYKRYKVTKTDQFGNQFQEYVEPTQNLTLLKLSDYILSREPIVTAFGTMFKHHGTVPNPLMDVVQSFLDNRTKHKKQMFQFPKGSEQFEKYNLLQALDKIDSNGIYGCLGQYTALIYNPNVATSITSQGRASVSSMALHFEMFLANNVKFGSLNEMIEFINHICEERKSRKYNDNIILNHIPSKEECFAKLVLDSGYRWVPNDKELDIIWQIVNNLTQEDITRIYYKNNLYEFASNNYVFSIIKKMLRDLKRPFFTSAKVPPEIADDLRYLKDLMMEYVYYRYMYIDRIDRCDNMIKSVTMVSDTDSTIISVDAWYRFVVNQINEEELRIANYCANPIMFIEKNEDGEYDCKEWMDHLEFEPKQLDYDFNTDEIVERERFNKPDILTANDNVRYSIISIISYVLDHTVNDYMIKGCQNCNSVKDPYHNESVCKIYAKNEFLFQRLLMTMVKKNYASIMEIQEGNMVPKNKQLDVKGIEILTKSSKALSTRKALQKILLDDILRAPVIDQLKFVKDIAIFQKQIVDSVRSGSKEFYKPVTIKSMSAYDDPMRIQGIKASIAWNMIKPAEADGINLSERNAVDIAKVQIDRATMDRIKDTFPEVYMNIQNALDDDTFKTYVKNPKTGRKDKLTSNEIVAVAIPLDTTLPPWLEPFIDYDSILADNLNGFPYESIGIKRLSKNNINCTNIVQL